MNRTIRLAAAAAERLAVTGVRVGWHPSGRPALARARRDAQIEEWAGDGHFVHLVDPGRFATRLCTFIEHCDQAG